MIILPNIWKVIQNSMVPVTTKQRNVHLSVGLLGWNLPKEAVQCMNYWTFNGIPMPQKPTI